MDKHDFKAWRKKQGFTQQQAADALGLFRVTIVNYERGSRMDSPNEVKIPLHIALACAAIEAGLKPVGKED